MFQVSEGEQASENWVQTKPFSRIFDIWRSPIGWVWAVGSKNLIPKSQLVLVTELSWPYDSQIDSSSTSTVSTQKSQIQKWVGQGGEKYWLFLIKSFNSLSLDMMSFQIQSA